MIYGKFMSISKLPRDKPKRHKLENLFSISRQNLGC